MHNYKVAAGSMFITRNSYEVVILSEVALENSEVAHLAHHLAGERLA